MYSIEESKFKDLITSVSTIKNLIKDIAPEDLYARDVSTKWVEVINEIQELEDNLEEIKNPPVEEVDIIDDNIEEWIQESTPIPEFND